MAPSRKIAFKTLGCRLNQYETDALASQFAMQGYEVVGFDEPADVVIVNTCTVTNQGDAKSRKAIHQAVRQVEHPVVVVTGCMVNSQKDRLRQMDGVTYFVENGQKTSIFQLVEAHFNGETVMPEIYSTNLFGFETAAETFHTRSYVKIQDGCDNFCTYCIVPKVRGRAISRPVNDILDNITGLMDLGFKEVVLTGVNIGRYDYNGTGFEDMVERILELPGDFRLRISSIEPEGFGDKLFNLFGHPKMTPHLHLCLQSGSDRILLLMRRFYTVSAFLGMVDKIRSKYPDFNLTTDIIVGFPGETEEDFARTCEVTRQVGFSHVHTFKYSVRSGTRAERMTDQVPEKVKQLRSGIIREIAAENKLRYRKSLIGREQVVLVEKYSPRTKMARGYGEHYVPVEFSASPQDYNNFVRVRITGITRHEDPILKGIVL